MSCLFLSSARKLCIVSFNAYLMLMGVVMASPKLVSVDPNPVNSGDQLTITGQGMEEINEVHIGSTKIEKVSVESSFGITCNTRKNCKSGVMQVIKVSVPKSIKAGKYNLSLSNAGGHSKSMPIKIN